VPPKSRVVVVGLGPAGADLLLPAARAALERVPVRLVRTARHPAVDDLAREGIDLEPLDLLYDRADDLDTVYAAIADRVVETARERGEIVYAVPGSPTIAERSVELVRAAGIDVELIPGISFVDLAWWRLGIDPMHGARVVDARAFAIDAAGSSGPMLIAQCDSLLVCSEVKLALLETLPAEHEITVLQRLGLADESVFTVALADLDRDVEPDHLTSLFVDTGAAAVGPELARLLALTERLRGPGGCPWDQAQTHHTLRRHVLEEAYEVVEAIEQLPAGAPAGDVPIGAYEALEDELGDLLFQVMIQSVLASEAGAFTVADVACAVHAKLIRRHPHVFGDVRVSGANEVVTNWEQIKKTEKDDQSLVAGVTAGLPALIAAQKLFRKGASIGLDPAADLADAISVLAGAEGPEIETALGAALASVVAVGRSHDIDAESALASWARRYKDRFRRMEQLAVAGGVDLAAADPAAVRDLWNQAETQVTEV
jgi:tetrapyrrole methylase family protein/MazG family protein